MDKTKLAEIKKKSHLMRVLLIDELDRLMTSS